MYNIHTNNNCYNYQIYDVYICLIGRKLMYTISLNIINNIYE